MADDAGTPTVSLYKLLEPGGNLTLKDASMVRVLTAFAETGSISEACLAAEVSRASWYRWRKEEPAFNEVVEQILTIRQQKLEDDLAIIESNLIERAKTNSEDARFVLKAKKREYRERQVIEVVSPEVTTRLQRQADAIMQLCAMELPEPHRTQFPAKLAAALEQVWK